MVIFLCWIEIIQSSNWSNRFQRCLTERERNRILIKWMNEHWNLYVVVSVPCHFQEPNISQNTDLRAVNSPNINFILIKTFELYEHVSFLHWQCFLILRLCKMFFSYIYTYFIHRESFLNFRYRYKYEFYCTLSKLFFFDHHFVSICILGLDDSLTWYSVNEFIIQLVPS